jgi:Flp pilus assembly protein TadG
MIMLTVMMTSVLVPLVGLAIDGGILFMTKAKLQTAVDAASLAGGRSLSVGLDLPSQTASCTNTVNAYFAANFPNGWFGASNANVAVNIAQSAFKTRTVTVTASVQSPLYFLRILGLNNATVAAGGATSRRDVNLILTLDRSSSMQSAGVCGTMKANAIAFVDKFTEGRDRLGLITFMEVGHLDYAPTMNFKTQNPTLEATIGTLACGGNTGSAQALNMAYQQIKAINEAGALNIIVFFTDGLPNGLVSNTFPVKTQADTRYGVGSTSTLVATPKSSCTGTTLPLGVIAQWGGDLATGPTDGLFNSSGVAINSTSQPTVTSPGCSYNSNTNNLRQDLAYIPTVDFFNNPTTGYTPVDTYPNGPYQGKIRVDTPISIGKASKNAADAQATTIRSDNLLTPVIYVIGLGGTVPEPLDQVFLQRVANDPASPIYNPAQQTGKYVYAPDATQLQDAFNTIASEILRISQ